MSEGAPLSGDPTGQGPDLPALPPGDVLTALPAGNVSDLETALMEFLAGLGKADSGQSGDGGWTWLYPWVVTGVAAAVAGEVARRRLRQTAAAALHIDGIPHAG
jgi:hypothetical protein